MSEKKSTVVFGVDPGASGGYAVSVDGVIVGGWKCSNNHLTEFIEHFNEYKTESRIMALEWVPKFVGKLIPSSASFTLGKSCGIFEGIARGQSVPIFPIPPKTWQRPIPGIAKLKGPERKRGLRDYAYMRFPDFKPTLATCDALLILDYFLQNNNK